ncbi:E3 ubiquitin-protein ligase ATL4-like [Ananas comosus]|uniref:E3 ubiquitin-protein ligase ATL4-like n=1 Tax=Ananas comosus TaxID=4615 RepID=A0A6P5HLN9_ANACO|nr:E3 ubiquitin-protein ligase ATL4-like [Ananas comosus]
MGFPSVYYCVILPKPLILVIQLLDSLRHAMFLSLFYLGLAPSVVEDYYTLPPLSTAAAATATTLTAIATATATATATPPPLSPPVTPSAIKARLRTVRFASSSKIPSSSSSSSSTSTPSSPELGEEPMCAVCLGPLKAKDEVRELGGCCHVFHKGCIDKWVDMGQVTCPLCRAFLLAN